MRRENFLTSSHGASTHEKRRHFDSNNQTDK